MTDSDHSDDGKGFLARWSQRKQEAKQPEPEPDAPAAGPDVTVAADAHAEAAEEFDLSSLPKLDELTGSTDITAFLRKGVPEHLRNEALRKSWALDPAIRNYVNPALEYAYDWNTPGGVPGSGEIGAGTDVARLVSQIMGSGDLVTEPSIPADETAREQASAAGQSLEEHAVQAGMGAENRRQCASYSACDIDKCLAWDLPPLSLGGGYALAIRGANSVINSVAVNLPDQPTYSRD